MNYNFVQNLGLKLMLIVYKVIFLRQNRYNYMKIRLA